MLIVVLTLQECSRLLIDPSEKYSLLNLVGSILDKNDQVSSLVQHGFRTLIGDGLIAYLWEDN